MYMSEDEEESGKIDKFVSGHKEIFINTWKCGCGFSKGEWNWRMRLYTIVSDV